MQFLIKRKFAMKNIIKCNSQKVLINLFCCFHFIILKVNNLNRMLSLSQSKIFHAQLLTNVKR